MKIEPKASNMVIIEAEVDFTEYKIVIHEGAILRITVSVEGEPSKEIRVTPDGVEIQE